jgi:hypothetical protein
MVTIGAAVVGGVVFLIFDTAQLSGFSLWGLFCATCRRRDHDWDSAGRGGSADLNEDTLPR